MSSRDIWSCSGSLQVRDLLASLLAARFLAEPSVNPLYVCSPYLTDFPVFDNSFGQFRALFRHRPDFGENNEVLFSQALIELSNRMPVRLIGVPGPYADVFLRSVVRFDVPNISARYASDLYHEKGLLCQDFYLEGSMNFTYSGVYRRDEKVTSHTPDTPSGTQKINAALLEFNRLWEIRETSEIART
jgi:hypothetical protein